jgi:uncharacterized protein with PhoU and TrkA domain
MHGRAPEAGAMGLVVLQLAGVLAALLAGGMLVVPRLVRWVVAGGAEGIAVLAVGLAFGFALLADQLGYSVVVAIHKASAEVVLPTGHEALEAGDVLALAGAPEAVTRARALLDR